MDWTRLGRLMAWLTVALVALTMTGGAVALWLATHGPSPWLTLAPMSRAGVLAVYVVLMVTPWWALLAVGFARLGWLEKRPAAPSRPMGDARAAKPSTGTETRPWRVA